MTIRLQVDVDELTWAEFETLQKWDTPEKDFAAMRQLMARFMVDEQGKPVDVQAALAMLGGLKRTELNAAIVQFAEALSVPNPKGGE